MDYLTISEDFYTIQGEGFSTGVPAYFVRLKDCNLTCGASMQKVREVKEAGAGAIESGSFEGDLHSNGKATWTCDTIPVWTFGHKKPFDYLISRWDEQGLLNDIASGLIHVIWTGGEPTLPRSQKCIIAFDEYFRNYCKMNDLLFNPFYEIETNGTFPIEDELLIKLNQINCSVKLSNSGMTKDQRVVPAAIESIKSHPFYTFKFVISTEEDLIEAFDTFVRPFNIPLYNICIMPGLDDQDNFHERTLFSMEMAKKYKVRGLTRLHVSAWNKTTGV